MNKVSQKERKLKKTNGDKKRNMVSMNCYLFIIFQHQMLYILYFLYPFKFFLPFINPVDKCNICLHLESQRFLYQFFCTEVFTLLRSSAGTKRSRSDGLRTPRDWPVWILYAWMAEVGLHRWRCRRKRRRRAVQTGRALTYSSTS